MAQSKWNSTTAPADGAIVYVLAQDDRGQYAIPFPVVFRDDIWWNARTGEELEAFVAAWRPTTMADEPDYRALCAHARR